MFITAEMLKEYGACEQGIRYIERTYPNGVELIDIIRNPNVSKEMLHWGRKHLTHGEEELAVYCEACKITNTEGFWYSQNVRDSRCVIKSKDVATSVGVFDSNDIVDCVDIVNGENVMNCKQIFHSSMIDDSEKILRCQNVTNCTNVCNSTMVANSKSVIDSFNIFDSSEIINCVSVSQSHFCQDCKDIKHCLFCDGLEGAEYHIFNKPVDKNLYEIIEKQYFKYLTEQLDFVRDWPSELVASIYLTPSRKFDDWFCSISDKFWKWAKTLPGFDAMMLYKVTMLPELLINE